MPSLKKAKDLAAGAVCSANYRQFGNGFSFYAEENQQVWPKTFCGWYNNAGAKLFSDWLGGISVYLNVPSVQGRSEDQAGYKQWVQDCKTNGAGSLLFCPSCKVQLGSYTYCATTAGVFQNTYNISYKDKDPGNWLYAYSLNARFTRAQNTVLLGEKLLNSNYYIIDSGSYLANIAPGDPPVAGGAYYSHCDKINLLFNDGHVQREEMLPPPYKQVRGEPQVDVQYASWPGAWDHVPQLLTVSANAFNLLYWEKE